MKILILSPHTDDAELGCGGSIVKFINAEHDIFWIVFSTAEESLPANMPADTLKNEFLNVLDNIGLKEKYSKIFDFNVRKLHEHRQEILENLVDIREEFIPDIVIGPSLNDFHQDHQVVAMEMVRAFKTISSIISYEIPWNHMKFNTQLFSKLTKDHMAQKCEILSNYKSQLLNKKLYFTKDFIYGLANTRGVQCNSKYAEAFEVIRWII